MTEIDAQPQVTPERLMQFAFSFAPPLILEAAIRHRIFDVLDEGPKTAKEVGTATGASERGLRALMNALVGLEFLEKDDEGRYSLTAESAAFLVSTKRGFHGGIFRHASTQLLPSWLNLNEIVRTGQPAAAVNREGIGAQFFQEFVEDIFPMSYPAAQALADVLGVPQTEHAISVLDLAAGSGVWGIALAQKSPHVQVTAIDWVDVIAVTRRMTARFGVEDRFRFVEGDLMEVDFGINYTIATLGHILHSEGEERGRRLLKKTFDALAPGGMVAVAEWLVNEERTGPPHALIFAVNMLVHTEGGDTFSFGEISTWLQDSGFEDIRTVEAPGPGPLILAVKPGLDTRDE